MNCKILNFIKEPSFYPKINHTLTVYNSICSRYSIKYTNILFTRKSKMLALAYASAAHFTFQKEEMCMG